MHCIVTYSETTTTVYGNFTVSHTPQEHSTTKIHHPDIFAGGTWLNHGFSTAEIENISLDSPWEVKWIDEKKIEWAENILEVANG
ncbi:MAG: hypothetical protein NTX75_01475 [Proteobacteria bacterium]|nr:hypothetical protein [Pseudomonadota bacterium]